MRVLDKIGMQEYDGPVKGTEDGWLTIQSFRLNEGKTFSFEIGSKMVEVLRLGPYRRVFLGREL